MSRSEPMEFLPVAAPRTIWLKVFMVVIILVCLLPFAIIGRTSYGAAGMRYELTGDELVISYPPSTVRIPRAEIIRAYVAERLTEGRRTNGTSLPGLYQGHWTFAETGPITLYNTSTKPVVILETGERKWGLTPVDPQGFLASLHSGRTGSWEPLRSGSPAAGFWVAGLILIPAGFALAMFIYFLRLPKQLRYTLLDDSLEIRGGWIRKVIPYDQIASVTIDSPKGWPWRTFGASFPGLYFGNFRWRGVGKGLRLFATRLRPLVLISTGSATYGITPADDQTFVAELTHRMAGGRFQ